VSKRRVVVTGMGMVSPMGLGVEESWRRVVAGQSGITPVESIEVDDLPVRFAGQLKGFSPEAYMDKKDVRKADTFIQYGIAAAEEAFEDSGLLVNESNADRIGVAIGSGIGGLKAITESNQKLVDGGVRKVSPFFIPSGIINMISGQVSIRYGLKGPNIAIVTACTTGTHNIGQAARAIAYGDADVMLAGGSEAAVHRLTLAGFAASRALSTRNDEPEKASRPWDKDRDGFVVGEGAGVVVIEELEHAKARGANIVAELVGFGMSADAYHITLPEADGEGFLKSMVNALNDSGLNATDIDYINAHGTSTPAGDPIECKAVKRLLGDHAYEIAVSSTKSMTGHMIAAAGSVEAIFSALSIRDQVAPPTINLDNPDEGCDLNFVPNEAQERKIDTVLTNSFGFGGTNGTLILRRYTD
jgi:3-oxoacyl-[acyl-carrier-protein] synthase II